MKIEETGLKDCYVIVPEVFGDHRGYFLETFSQKKFNNLTGQNVNFVQDNQSKSSRGVLRGLHFQKGEYAQAKLVRVAQGSVLDVCVDLRKDSPTFGEHFSITLDDKDHKQLFVPRGFAHGFIVLEDDTLFNYKCDNYYNKASEGGVIYNDSSLNIDWVLDEKEFKLSEKDIHLPELKFVEL